MAAAIEIFGSDYTRLRAEVPAQTGVGIATDLGAAKMLSPGEIKDRGIKLRADLDQAFDGLLDSAKAGHADEFTAIVRLYISAGMALEDAEAILRAAGFSEPPPSRARVGQDQKADGYAVVAEIPQFSGRVFGNVEVYVMLRSPEERLAEFVGRRHRLLYDPRP